MTQKLTDRPVALASDHRGVALKARLKDWLLAHCYAVRDCGVETDSERVDAMDYALRLVAELKATSAVTDADRRQLLNYLRCSSIELGLLLHFGPKPSLQRLIYSNTAKRTLAASP